MPQNAAFHQGLHCLLRQMQSYGIKVQINLKSSICEPLKYLNDNPISNQFSVWEYPPEIHCVKLPRVAILMRSHLLSCQPRVTET